MKKFFSKIKFCVIKFLEWFRSLNNVGKIVCVFIGGGMLIVLAYGFYLMSQYASLIFAVLTIWFVVKLERTPDVYNVPNFYSDIENIRQCCFEMINNLSELYGWISPKSPQSVEIPPKVMGDDIQRYFFIAKKKVAFENMIFSVDDYKIIEDELNIRFRLYYQNFGSEIHGFFLDSCSDKGAYVEMVILPVNDSTNTYIQLKQAQRISEYEKITKIAERPMTVKPKLHPCPYCKKIAWECYHTPIFIEQNLTTHPHILVVGATGQGKTYAILLITAHILSAYKDCDLYVSDYKGQDYVFLNGCRRYFSHSDYFIGLEQFHDKLENRIRGNDTSENRCLLVLDEWNNFISSLSTNKERDFYIQKLSFCLNMGRSYKMNVLVGSQVGHVEFFGKSRDSFTTKLGLGTLSKESISMLFRDEYECIKPQSRGNGYLLQDGFSLQEIIIPTMPSIDLWKKHYIFRCNREPM